MINKRLLINNICLSLRNPWSYFSATKYWPLSNSTTISLSFRHWKSGIVIIHSSRWKCSLYQRCLGKQLRPYKSDIVQKTTLKAYLLEIEFEMSCLFIFVVEARLQHYRVYKVGNCPMKGLIMISVHALCLPAFKSLRSN